MIMIDQSVILAQLKKFGFVKANLEGDVYEKLNNIIFSYIKKLVREYKKNQDGGRIVMPLEYFGVDSHHYHDSPGNFTDMQVTESYIRPPMMIQQGGDTKKTFILRAEFVGLFLQAIKVQSYPKKMTDSVKKAVEKAMTEFLNALKDNIKDKSEKLTAKTIDKVYKKTSPLLLKKK